MNKHTTNKIYTENNSKRRKGDIVGDGVGDIFKYNNNNNMAATTKIKY